MYNMKFVFDLRGQMAYIGNAFERISVSKVMQVFTFNVFTKICPALH